MKSFCARRKSSGRSLRGERGLKPPVGGNRRYRARRSLRRERGLKPDVLRTAGARTLCRSLRRERELKLLRVIVDGEVNCVAPCAGSGDCNHSYPSFLSSSCLSFPSRRSWRVTAAFAEPMIRDAPLDMLRGRNIWYTDSKAVIGWTSSKNLCLKN